MTEWRETGLGEVITLQRGYDLTEKESTPGPFPVISSGGCSYTTDVAKVAGPGVVTGRKGVLGKVHYSPGPYWPHDTTLWVKDFKGSDPRFVYYLLQTLPLASLDAGASNPTLNRNHAHLLPVRVPAPSTQRSIGSVLASMDDLIENSRRRAAVLEEMARAIYREWFVRFRYPGHEDVPLVNSPLGPVPEGWSVRALRECAHALVDGDWVETKDQGGSAYRLIQVSNIGLGVFRETGKYRYITEETFRRLNCTEVAVGDILISRMPEPVGRAWLVDYLDEQAVTVVDVALLTPISEPMGVYLSQVLNSPEQLSHAATVATGTTRKRITRSVLAQSLVLVPDDVLLARFCEQCEPALRMARSLRLACRALVSMRDLLLPKLVTGQIDVSHLDLDALTEAAVA